jgi:hypothetical protein
MNASHCRNFCRCWGSVVERPPTVPTIECVFRRHLPSLVSWSPAADHYRVKKFCMWSLYSAKWIPSVPSWPTFWRTILILSSHLRLSLPIFPSVHQTTLCMHFTYTVHRAFPAYLISMFSLSYFCRWKEPFHYYIFFKYFPCHPVLKIKTPGYKFRVHNTILFFDYNNLRAIFFPLITG